MKSYTMLYIAVHCRIPADVGDCIWTLMLLSDWSASGYVTFESSIAQFRVYGLVLLVCMFVCMECRSSEVQGQNCLRYLSI